LYCGDNPLTSLDVTANTALSKLCCVQPTLTGLFLNNTQQAFTITSLTSHCASVELNNIHKHKNTCINNNNHTGGTHTNNGVCGNCGETYQEHSDSGVTYTQTETGHIPHYGCTYAECEYANDGEEEAHTGATSCTKCGWRLESSGASYILRVDNGKIRSVLTVIAGELVYVGLSDLSDATYIVNSGNVTLIEDGNRRKFYMPENSVDITIK